MLTQEPLAEVIPWLMRYQVKQLPTPKSVRCVPSLVGFDRLES